MDSEEATSRDRNFYPTLMRANRRFLSLRTLYIFCFVLVVACGAGFFGLRWFEKAATFHPVRYASGPASNMPQGGEDVWFQTADGLRLHGWFISSRADKAAGTIIYSWQRRQLRAMWDGSALGWLRTDSTFCCSTIEAMGAAREMLRMSEPYILMRMRLMITSCASAERILRSWRFTGNRSELRRSLIWQSRLKVGAIILESGLSSASDMASAMLPWMPRWLHALGRNRFESARKLE